MDRREALCCGCATLVAAIPFLAPTKAHALEYVCGRCGLSGSGPGGPRVSYEVTVFILGHGPDGRYRWNPHRTMTSPCQCQGNDLAATLQARNYRTRVTARRIETQPVEARLGRRWSESESGWSGTWTRRGTSNVFDAVWTQGAQRPITAVLTIHMNGNQVRIERRHSSDRNDCDYQGTLQPNGRTVYGTYTCVRDRVTRNWQATIGG